MRANPTNKLIAGILGMLLVTSCLDPFGTPATVAEKQYLVVDGFLNDINTSIRLTRSMNLDESFAEIESGAAVQIEAEDGSIYGLTESAPGSYTAATLPVSEGKSYRLRIKTGGQSEYVSDFVPFKTTPPIDSLYWIYKNGDINILIDSHDDRKNTVYYMWRYDETWNYHVPYVSTVKFVNGGIVQRALDDRINNCWKTRPSTAILISNTARLERDFISQYIVNPIPLTSEVFQNKYSIEVEEFALTKEAYEYWQQLKKNTEDIGSIFGPQPSQITSNIHGVTNPDEPVVGYFSGCTAPRKRIFIAYEDLPRSTHDNPYVDCEIDTLLLKDIPNNSGASLLITELFRGTELIGYSRSSYFCVDCTLHGGAKEMPAFWK